MRLHRKKAKERLAEIQLSTLSDERKLEALSEYWYCDTEKDVRAEIETGDLPHIGPELIHLIASTPAPVTVPAGCEPLLLDWLNFKLNKAKNQYLERLLTAAGHAFQVYGEVEPAGLCPCCEYYSIDAGEDGLWVCPVCFWENGGDGPNHMALADARANFRAIGAMSQRSLEFVDPEGPAKFRQK